MRISSISQLKTHLALLDRARSMKNLLLALILTTTAAQAGPPDQWVENPGPHVIKATQPSCQNVSDYDDLSGKILLANTELRRREARALYESLTDPNNPANGCASGSRRARSSWSRSASAASSASNSRGCRSPTERRRTSASGRPA